MRNSVPKNQIRAIAMAMAGGIVAAVATMFVPVAVLEIVAGSSGLSELIPAARAPLGDTARALIAFGAGAFTLAILAYFLLRHENSAPASVHPSEWANADSVPSFKDRLAHFKPPSMVMPKMPWSRGEDAITELADLPKLRYGDSHPDAPARRPLIASLDLPVLDLVEQAETIIGEEPEVTVTDAPIEPVPETAAKPEIAQAPIAMTGVEPTLAEMVAQLEAAVAERQKQLAELEAVATKLAASPAALQEAATAEQTETMATSLAPADIEVEPPYSPRPTLEAVPASATAASTTAAKDDDMDSALAAALATLHRMNATGR